MTGEQLRGVDVASYQGAVDWPAVAAAGISFGFTKATGGAWYVNPTFEANWYGIRSAGLARGAYAYAFESSGQPFPGPGPEAEAQFFLDTVLPLGLEPGDMLVLDIEEAPSEIDVGAWCLAWLRHVENTVGFVPLIYTGAWFSGPHGFGSCPDLAQYPLWLAAYQTVTPPAPAPWTDVTFWQFTADGTCPGIAGPCDLNDFLDDAAALPSYGKPAESQPLPVYNWAYPTIPQEEDFDCSETALLWALRAWGLDVDESWLERTMIDEGVMSEAHGLMDASGASLANFVNRHWGPAGFVATNQATVGFTAICDEAGSRLHPICSGGRAWNHWTGVRDFDQGADLLLLANPADGWGGVHQSLARTQFAQLGPFSLVRVRHPAAEEAMELDYSPWHGRIGTGLLDMMAADGVLPAQRQSTWLPLGVTPSDIEEAVGENGVTYRWLLQANVGYRTSPD